ncbi:MAG: type II toxin-antitoxin system RelE/ParE family toxin [Desulfobacterales bacterium]|nr:type II toxin-antitoxin system RelE/ParE family toxin [Desulfobacterales bacterium]
MKILQSRSFERKVKNFTKRKKKKLDEVIRKIVEKTSIGSKKKGDLRGVYVHKFKIQAVRYLLAYRFVGKAPKLIMIGPHENHYRDLKSYLKSRKKANRVAGVGSKLGQP